MVTELREFLRAMWARLRRTENWIFGMSQMPLIIEEGTSGIWRYRKWSNGVAECWGKYSATISHYVSALGGYGYKTDSLAFPTNLFIEAPIPTFSAYIGSGFALTGTLTSAISATNCIFYAVSTASGSQSTIWYIHAVGKWKITTDTPQNLIDLLYDAHAWDYNYLENLPKLNGQTISGNKTLADYGFTGTIANDKMGYTTTVPTADNLDGLKIVVLDEEPEVKYEGWLYLIKESE